MNDQLCNPRIVSNYSTSNIVWQTRANPSNKLVDPLNNTSSIYSYNVKPRKYIIHASNNRPKLPGKRVSDFTDWIYLLEGKSPFAERLHAGSEAEKQILHKKLNSRSAHPIPTQPDSDWELFHCGMRINDEMERAHFYEIPSLLVNGSPIRASPDLVYLNHKLKKAIVVEIKYSRATISSNLWPNVWAQLWAYAHIPPIQSMRDIILIGEVWGEEGSPPYTTPLESEIFLRASVHRDPRNPSFDRFFRTLFNIYAGNG